MSNKFVYTEDDIDSLVVEDGKTKKMDFFTAQEQLQKVGNPNHDEHGRFSSGPGGGGGGGEQGKTPQWVKEERTIMMGEGEKKPAQFDFYRNPDFEKPKGVRSPLYHDTSAEHVSGIQKDGLVEHVAPGQQSSVWHNTEKDFLRSDPEFYQKGDTVVKSWARGEKSEQGVETGSVPTKYIEGYLVKKTLSNMDFFFSLEKSLPAGAKAGDYIDDFVHSGNKRFKGKSKTERIQMALGAYYGKVWGPAAWQASAEARRKLTEFKSDLQRAGIRHSEVFSQEGEPGVHIHNRDITQAQEEHSTKLANKHDMKIIITDKGAAFHPKIK